VDPKHRGRFDYGERTTADIAYPSSQLESHLSLAVNPPSDSGYAGTALERGRRLNRQRLGVSADFAQVMLAAHSWCLGGASDYRMLQYPVWSQGKSPAPILT